jgi:hypothetical protein
MKNIKKQIVYVIIAVLVVVFILYMVVFREKYKEEQVNGSFINIVRIIDDEPDKNSIEKRKQEVEKIKASSDNIVEDVDVEDDYAKIIISVNNKQQYYYLGYKDKLTIGMLVESIGQILGYEIKTNSISISEKSIKIDFDKGYAPFKVTSKVVSENTQNVQVTSKQLEKCVLDSIALTIKNNNKRIDRIYYSVDKKSIEINNKKISKNKEYNA